MVVGSSSTLFTLARKGLAALVCQLYIEKVQENVYQEEALSSCFGQVILRISKNTKTFSPNIQCENDRVIVSNGFELFICHLFLLLLRGRVTDAAFEYELEIAY